jgi:DNA adenine methylase
MCIPSHAILHIMNKQQVEKVVEQYGVNHIYAQYLLRIAEKDKTEHVVEELLKNRPRPFIKWVGGKRQLLQQFRDRGLYPPNDFDPIMHTYFEPFVGGGAVFFDLLPKKAELSDLNNELVTTYNVIKNNVDDLISLLKTHKYEKEHYLAVRAQDPNTLSDIEIAARFIFLNKTCFNGMYRVNSKGVFNVPFGAYANPVICDEENLRKVSMVLQAVTIRNQDYTVVLKRAKKRDFVYFDPPYYPVSKTASFTSYTANSFLETDQRALRDVFVELHERGCFVMLSNSDTHFIRKLYSGLVGVRVSKVYAGRAINSNAAKRGKISEVLVTNY